MAVARGSKILYSHKNYATALHGDSIHLAGTALFFQTSVNRILYIIHIHLDILKMQNPQSDMWGLTKLFVYFIIKRIHKEESTEEGYSK